MVTKTKSAKSAKSRVKPKPLTAKNAFPVSEAYDLWLQGWSLRSIGAKYAVGRMLVLGRFRKRYGINACNRRQQGLARAVQKDYGQMDLTNRCRNTPGLYRSFGTERSYTRHQTIPLSPKIECRFSSEEFRQEPPLRLDLLVLLLSVTSGLLAYVIGSTPEDDLMLISP